MTLDVAQRSTALTRRVLAAAESGHRDGALRPTAPGDGRALDSGQSVVEPLAAAERSLETDEHRRP